MKKNVWRSRCGTVELLRADAFEFLSGVAQADAVISDPPYGVTDCEWDVAPDLHQLGELLKSISRETSTWAVFATQPFATDVINAWRKMFRYDLIWGKHNVCGYLNANKQPLRRHEHLLIFGRDRRGATYCPQKKPGKPYAGGIRKNSDHVYGKTKNPEYAFPANPGERHPTSILEIDETNRRTRHPTAKPLPLCQWLVKSYTRPGDMVVDPYSGSGTTAAACLTTGRRFIGSERDPEIFERAVRYLESLQASR